MTYNPDAPITITLPARIMDRVFRAVVRDAYLTVKRVADHPDDAGLRALAEASRVIGDAIGAPAHRRFYYRNVNGG
jgi:hypothetical protein